MRGDRIQRGRQLCSFERQWQESLGHAPPRLWKTQPAHDRQRTQPDKADGFISLHLS
jgi:hypothetical protein